MAALATPDFWVAIGFIIFVLLIIKPVTKAITAALDSRAEKIRTTLDDAANLREEAQKMLAEYQRKQREAAREIEEIVSSARAEAERLTADARTALEESLKRREQLGREKIAQAEADAVADVRNFAVDIAIDATREILTEKMDDKAANDLLEDAIKDLPQRLH